MPSRAANAKPSARPRLIAVVGPTASGKTDLAIALAKRLGGEVISADSRQVYRGVGIAADVPKGVWRGRGKARAYVVRGVPHHLLAFIDPAEPFTLSDWLRLAEAKAADIIARGRLPIVCGGTGLYVRALLEGFAPPSVPPNPALRKRLEAKTSARLHAILKKFDAEHARRIPLQNRRYVIRALEVIAATGRPFLAQQGRAAGQKYDALMLGLKTAPEELSRRIGKRVDSQVRRGLLAESKRLLRRLGRTAAGNAAATSLGIRQLAPFFAGEMAKAEAIELIKRDTRKYAKRQLTWFRRDKDIRWCRTSDAALRMAERWAARH